MTPTNYALYYPTIEFRDYEWLWSASLLWDRIYRIVPESYMSKDPDNVRALIESGEIGEPLSPGPYAEQIATEFIQRLKSTNWNARTLQIDLDHDADYVNLHRDKVDVVLRNIIEKKGSPSTEWIRVPREFGALYMTYLANSMAVKNRLQLISDSTAAWTASTYFHFDGNIHPETSQSLTPHLAVIVMRDFLPENILALSPSQILRFRRERAEERRRFLQAIKNGAATISACHDPKVLADKIEDFRKDVSQAVTEYKRSADILRVTGWAGIKSITFPILAPIVSQLTSLAPEVSGLLGVLGLGLGVVTGLSELDQKQNKLSTESDYSYLLHASKQLRGTSIAAEYDKYLSQQIKDFIYD